MAVQCLLWTLLLWGALTLDIVKGDCVITEHGPRPQLIRCVCSADFIQNQKDLLPDPCVHVHEMEICDGHLGGITYKVPLNPQELDLIFIPLKKYIFTRVSIAPEFLDALLRILPFSNVKELDFTNSSVEGVEPSFVFPRLNSILKKLRMEGVNVSSLLHPSLHPLRAWLLPPLRTLALVGSGLSDIECGFAMLLMNVTQLDLSENRLTESSLANLSHCPPPPVSFHNLSSLSLRRNLLTSFQALCGLLERSPVLQDLDVSWNNFSIPPSGCFQDDMSLRVLNLSHARITEAEQYLPRAVEVLDLSGNTLERFGSPPKGLRELYLSYNRLLKLPSLGNMDQLQVLKLEGNQLTSLTKEPGSLVVLKRLVVVKAGGNPYQCDCSLRETLDLLESHRDAVKDRTEFVCYQPLSRRGTLLYQLHLSFYECHHAAAACLICLAVIVAVLVVGAVSYKVYSVTKFNRQQNQRQYSHVSSNVPSSGSGGVTELHEQNQTDQTI